MKKSSYLLICQVSVVLALGCDSIVLKKLEQQNPSEGADHQLPDEALPSEDISYAALKLDFSDAIALLVSESSSSVALASNSISGSNLKKVTPDGTIEDIVITGKAEIENFMIGPSKRFYGLLKNRSAWGAHESCLLFTVSLDRGEPTCIDNSLTSISWSPDNAVLANPAIQFDSSGAVYYSGLDESGQRVLRMFDGEQTRDLLKGRFELNDFIVLRDGTVYLLGSTLDTGTQWFRMLAPDGSLSDLTMPGTSSSIRYMKLFPDGNIYYGTSNGLERIFTKSHKASSVSWISSRSPTIYTDAESGSAGDQVKKFFATADETIIGVSRLLNSNDYGLIRFFPTPEKLSLTMLSNITNVQSVGSNLLLAGTDSDGRNRLVMYNTANSQETDLIPEEEIEIFNFMMSADQEKVYFDGLRFSDSTFVIAEYDLNSHRLAYLVKLPGKPKILDIIKDCTVPANSADYGSEGSWTTVTQTNAPGARSGHQSVWTGNEVLIWGGAITAAGGELQTGGLYSPNSDSWRATSLVNAPTKRSDFSMTWTGDKAIVFGGIYWGSSTVFLAEPKAYDPANDTWTSLSETNAPSARASHTAVWTGSRLIVWGGIASGSNELNTGAVYDPSSDTWTTMSTVSAPSARAGHTAVWTGSKMIVFGGYGSQGDLGGVYDPSTDSWTSLSTDGAPSIRWHHSAVWTGTRMLVWGGVYDSSAGQNNPLYYADGYSYDADSDSWQLLSESGRPPERAAHTAVWTGSAMIIFGGNSALSLGGMYYPSNETWVPINHTNALTNRQGHSGLWIGDRMMIWGGKIEGGDAGDGGVFTP